MTGGSRGERGPGVAARRRASRLRPPQRTVAGQDAGNAAQSAFFLMLPDKEIDAALRERFPSLATPRKEDICYATQNRQDAVKQLVAQCDVIVVVGSQMSSNSNRLREIATTRGIPGYLVDSAEDLQREWFEGKRAVGVTAGASAPESLVKNVVERLREWGGHEAVEIVGKEERVVFGLPQALRTTAKPERTSR